MKAFSSSAGCYISDLQSCQGHRRHLSGNRLHGHPKHQFHGETDQSKYWYLYWCTDFQLTMCIRLMFTPTQPSAQINTTSDERDGSNPFRFANIGVEKFLELNSEQNHDDYCLAYVFTDRDFDDGVLGLAWVGAPSGTVGQVCESPVMSNGKQSGLFLKQDMTRFLTKRCRF